MNVKSQIIILELWESKRHVSHVLDFYQWRKHPQTMLLVLWFVEEVHTRQTIGEQIYDSYGDKFIVQIILHMVTSLTFCYFTTDWYFLLTFFLRIECWLIELIAFFGDFIILDKSQCSLTQKVRIWTETFFLLAMNVNTISLIHFPTVIILFCLNDDNFYPSESDFIWSNDKLSFKIMMIGL